MDGFLDLDTLVILYVLAGMLYVLLAWPAFYAASDEIRDQAAGYPAVIFFVSVVAVSIWPFVFVFDIVTYKLWRSRQK
jgi:hypothetical protein